MIRTVNVTPSGLSMRGKKKSETKPPKESKLETSIPLLNATSIGGGHSRPKKPATNPNSIPCRDKHVAVKKEVRYPKDSRRHGEDWSKDEENIEESSFQDSGRTEGSVRRDDRREKPKRSPKENPYLQWFAGTRRLEGKSKRKDERTRSTKDRDSRKASECSVIRDEGDDEEDLLEYQSEDSENGLQHTRRTEGSVPRNPRDPERMVAARSEADGMDEMERIREERKRAERMPQRSDNGGRDTGRTESDVRGGGGPAVRQPSVSHVSVNRPPAAEMPLAIKVPPAENVQPASHVSVNMHPAENVQPAENVPPAADVSVGMPPAENVQPAENVPPAENMQPAENVQPAENMPPAADVSVGMPPAENVQPAENVTPAADVSVGMPPGEKVQPAADGPVEKVDTWDRYFGKDGLILPGPPWSESYVQYSLSGWLDNVAGRMPGTNTISQQLIILSTGPPSKSVPPAESAHPGKAESGR